MTNAGPCIAEIAPVQFLTPGAIRVAPENSLLYGRFNPTDADDKALVDSIRRHGILTPLQVSADGYLLSGHRRLAAAIHADLDSVPVMIVDDVVFADLSPDERLQELRQRNHQREKTFDERVAEVAADVDPANAYEELIQYRAARQRPAIDANLEMGAQRTRATITTSAFLDAVLKIVDAHRDVWPISNRAIHYALLNDPPLTHDAKPDSVYSNTTSPNFPQKLSNLITRARITGIIPMEAICDETRPISTWETYSCPEAFVAKQQAKFLRGYWRDLMRGQPHHIEIVVEKETQRGAVEKVAADYTIPVTTSRGVCSLPPRYAMAERYHASAKDKLIVLLLSDHDPDGVQLARSFARSMRDDLHINKVHPIRVALTAEQIKAHVLPSSIEAKASSPNYKRFVAEYGTRAVELDAMPRQLLQAELRKAIEAVLDIPTFHHEQEQERHDAREIAAMRRAALRVMQIGGRP